MKLKNTNSYCKMLEEIHDNFGEYLEMGYCLETYILSLLHAEREKNNDFKSRIEYLERKCNI